MPAPIGRIVLLSHLEMQLEAGPERRAPPLRLIEFRLDGGLPVWRFAGEGVVMERHVLMPHRQNTVHVTFRLLEAAMPLRVAIRPFVTIRPHETLSPALAAPYTLTVMDDQFEIRATPEYPALR